MQYSVISNNPDREGEFSKTTHNLLTGPVVVTRNPCLHPGDVRLLTAVSAPKLSHLVDCVVFPNHGPRPHPSEMAGDACYLSYNLHLIKYAVGDGRGRMLILSQAREISNRCLARKNWRELLNAENRLTDSSRPKACHFC